MEKQNSNLSDVNDVALDEQKTQPKTQFDRFALFRSCAHFVFECDFFSRFFFVSAQRKKQIKTELLRRNVKQKENKMKTRNGIDE